MRNEQSTLTVSVPVLIVVMPGTCLEGHRPKTRQALTPSIGVWVRPGTQGPSPSSYCYANRLSIIRRKLQDERDPFPDLLACLDA